VIVRVVLLGLLAAAVTLAHAAGDVLNCPAPTNDVAAAADTRATSSDGPFTRAEASVPAEKRTVRGLYLTATDAYQMVSEDPANVLFIDVRTRGELQFIGMPKLVDAHVPIMVEAAPPQWDDVSSSFKLVRNSDFVAAVDKRLAQKRLTRDAAIVVICQGGLRAARAADALTNAGFTTVYTVVDGFEGDPVAEGPMKGLRLVNGWRNAGLPWTNKLDRSKMYAFE
jgi:rhodanese-related sulfurtransferase